MVTDELGQRWQVDSQDELWQDVLVLTKNGKEDAVLPLSLIISKRGWGWWSCFKTQDEWLGSIGIPIPDHQVLNDTSNLYELLQRFGGYIAFLETQIGLLAGRRNALKSAYEAAVAVRTSELTGSEKSKEAQVLSESETIRQTKRIYIETDMLYETAKGLCASYQRAWETCSRLATIQSMESNISPRRVP
jgi:hypothetical protein